MAGSVRSRGELRDPAGIPDRAVSDVSRNSGGPVPVSGAGREDCGVQARSTAYRDRGPSGSRGPALLRDAWNALHDVLSHSVSAVSALSLSDPHVGLVSGAPLVSQRRRT